MRSKTTLHFLSIIFLNIFLFSCGGKSLTEKTIKVSNVSVSGEGKQYFKVLDGDYTLKVVDGKITIPIKIEVIKKYDGKNADMGNISMIPLDKASTAIPNIGLDMRPATLSDYDKLKEALKEGSGKATTITFQWDYFSKKEIIQRIMNETENFEITRTDFTRADNNARAGDGNVSSDNEIAGDENWDKMLDDYGEYVDQYATFYKKSLAGDQSALAEYPAFLEKATTLSESMKKAKNGNKLTSVQLNRMVKIQNKMLTAMSTK